MHEDGGVIGFVVFVLLIRVARRRRRGHGYLLLLLVSFIDPKIFFMYAWVQDEH